MAQKREKEETELKVPETLSICSSTPPVTVSSPSPSQLPVTIDDQRINYVRSDPSPPPGVDGSRSSSIFDTTPERTDLVSCGEERKVVSDGINRSLKRPRDANRCSGPDCRRKLGLMGFRCRCGDMFCSEHRYSDRHGCSYDYKADGREAIARENPVVKAAKIIKV